MGGYTKRMFSATLAVLVSATMITVPRGSIASAKSNIYGKVNLTSTKLNNAGLQADITFPDYLDYVDDTLMVNNMFTFKGYKGQGKLYITASDGLENARMFINGQEVDITVACKNNGSMYEVDFSDISQNDRNTLQVTNFKPSTGKLNVKIPYPEVIEKSAGEAGMDQSTLDLIDTIINSDINNGFTSAQVAVIKDGAMIKNTAYGTINAYNQDGTPKTDSKEVTTDTLYDLASNSKMYGANYAIQKLVSDGAISITDKIVKYFPEFKDGENDPIKGKANLTIQNILEHQAGFPADPQYHNDKFNQETQKPDQNVDNPLYSRDKATTLEMILKTPLEYEPGTKTKYSDVDYMLLGLIVEKVTGQNLDVYLENTIYKPMGLTHTMFNPLQKGFTKENCAATELNGNTRDGAISFKDIRTETIQGEVHDEKAYYAMNGVSGHAGLFSNAGELAKLAQVMLNDGGYGNNKFFNKNTIEEFTKRKASSPTWGLGWWREGDNGRVWYFGPQSSSNTYGHQGWTGTLTVIDPESNLVIVLLTNKINSPVIDKEINPNVFKGNKFTTATLGTIPALVYESIIHNNQDAVDANVAQMAEENFKLYQKSKGSYTEEAVAKSSFSMVDTVLTRTEKNKTSENLSYAKEAVSRLDVSKHREQIVGFNERLIALGLTPVELPNTDEELAKLEVILNLVKTTYEAGQELGDHVHYQEDSWNVFVKSYEEAQAMAVKAKEGKASEEEILAVVNKLNTAKENLLRIDKTELNRLIEVAQAKVEDGSLDNVEEKAKKEFTESLEAAKAVYADKNVNMQNVIQAYNDLLIKYKNLGLPVGDSTELNALITMAEAIDLNQYLASGHENFNKALENAKIVAGLEESTEVQILEAFDELYNAMMSLVKKADKTMLNAEIETAKNMEISKYTEDSVKALNEALEAAKKVSSNEEATQNEVDEAAKALNEAMIAMIKGADKSDLKSQVEKANAIDLGKYTDETVSVLKKALSEANAILDNGSITAENQALVNKAVDNLQKAIDGLVLKDSNSQNGGNKPSIPNDEEEGKDQEDSTVDTNTGNTTENNEGKQPNKDAPETGDANIAGFALVGIASLAGIVAIKRKRK